MDGPGTRWVYIIAEMSGNHHQSLEMAKQLVREAAAARADAIKVQTYTPEEIAASHVLVPTGYNSAHDARLRRLYGNDWKTLSLRRLLTGGGLPRAWHAALKAEAAACGIDFLSTPFSVDAAKFLVNEVGVAALKIASGDVTFLPLLAYAATTGLPVLLSTGGAYLAEVWDAVTGPLAAAYDAHNLSLLHCVSSYPCPEAAVNLRAIRTLAEAFPLAIPGWSDHTVSPSIPALAVAAGARIIEKHLRLDLPAAGIDTDHSLPPRQFAAMVGQIREAEQALGDGVKAPHALEFHDRLWARRDPEDWLRPTARARAGCWSDTPAPPLAKDEPHD